MWERVDAGVVAIGEALEEGPGLAVDAREMRAALASRIAVRDDADEHLLPVAGDEGGAARVAPTRLRGTGRGHETVLARLLYDAPSLAA